MEGGAPTSQFWKKGLCTEARPSPTSPAQVSPTTPHIHSCPRTCKDRQGSLGTTEPHGRPRACRGALGKRPSQQHLEPGSSPHGH